LAAAVLVRAGAAAIPAVAAAAAVIEAEIAERLAPSLSFLSVTLRRC
jgi:hypothetical protein